jgi:hypothetical protein
MSRDGTMKTCKAARGSFTVVKTLPSATLSARQIALRTNWLRCRLQDVNELQKPSCATFFILNSLRGLLSHLHGHKPLAVRSLNGTLPLNISRVDQLKLSRWRGNTTPPMSDNTSKTRRTLLHSWRQQRDPGATFHTVRCSDPASRTHRHQS